MQAHHQATIDRIARRHGVLLGNDDPILMVQTMLDDVQEDIKHGQADRLKRFGEDLETGLLRWEEAAKSHSEAIINAALAAAHQNMTDVLNQTTDETIGRMKRESTAILAELRKTHQQQQRAAIACIAGAIGIIGLFVLEALRSGGIL